MNGETTAPDPMGVVVEETDVDDWGRAILSRWAAELDDPREEIYTVEDGTPYGPMTNGGT